MAHSRRFSGRRSPSLKTWTGQTAPAFGTDITGPGGTFSPGLKVFGPAQDTDYTVLRTRGNWFAKSDSLSLAIGNQTQIALGIGLCTAEAALAGAVPLPFENPDWDGWFLYTVMSLEGISAASGSVEGIENSETIDSKAMRKVQSGMALFLATQMFTAAGAGGDPINQSIQVRILAKTS